MAWRPASQRGAWAGRCTASPLMALPVWLPCPVGGGPGHNAGASRGLRRPALTPATATPAFRIASTPSSTSSANCAVASGHGHTNTCLTDSGVWTFPTPRAHNLQLAERPDSLLVFWSNHSTGSHSGITSTRNRRSKGSCVRRTTAASAVTPPGLFATRREVCADYIITC